VSGGVVGRNKEAEAEAVHADVRHEEHKHEDNLEIIEGIGPKVAKVLKAAGIASFSDLANASVAKVEEMLKAAGLNMMSVAGWIGQAKLAAKGDMEGLKKMQAEMKGRRLK
jgi:large subunit ribosomal protein L17